ncbi:MAG: hypothetical protein WC496_11655 [Phycisphaerae bacterium]|jgi:Tfp pilus assembly protein PilN
MSGILEKLCWGRAIGVYFHGDRVSITDVGNTIKGLATLNQQSFEIGDEDPVQSLSNILQEYIKNRGGKNTPVCLGLKPEQAFFITSAAECEQQEQLRDKLLDYAGFRTAEERNEVVADYFKINKVKSSAGQLWSVGVCQKENSKGLYNAIGQAGFKHFSLKPTPWAMAAFSAKLPKKSKSWKVLIHIFLNETGGLAVLVVEKNIMCWKIFAFSQSEPMDKIESAIRSILIQSTVTLFRPMVDGIVLEGPKAGKFGQEVYDRFGIETAAVEGPEFADFQFSHSLAMSARHREVTQFDIFRELRPKPTLKQMFPWKLAAMVVFAACCMAFMMWQRTSRLTESYINFKKQNAAYKWAQKKTTRELASEKLSLLTETQAVEKFLSTRIIWSDYLRDLPTRLPPNVSISNIWAVCEYADSSKKVAGRKKINRSMSLRGMTLFDKGRASPEDIEAFMESLKKVDLLQRDFPNVQLADIKWRRQGDSDVATFTVMASPDKSAKGKKQEKGGSEG